MLNLNSSTLAAVVEQAAHDAANHPCWLTAIARAILELESNPYLERNDHGGLLIGSSSGSVYSSNGICQCEAYTHGRKPCWHRAAARLVRLHDERESTQQQQARQAAERSTADKIARARLATQRLNELFA